MQRPLRKGHGMPRAISTARWRRTCWRLLRIQGTSNSVQCVQDNIRVFSQHAEMAFLAFSGNQRGQEFMFQHVSTVCGMRTAAVASSQGHLGMGASTFPRPWMLHIKAYLAPG